MDINFKQITLVKEVNGAFVIIFVINKTVLADHSVVYVFWAE